jgi:excisionase family DNA binding protein
MQEISDKKQEVKKEKGINNPLLPRLLALKDAAGYLGRTARGMRELYWAGKIPIVRDGKKIYFDRQDLDSYVQKNKTVYV